MELLCRLQDNSPATPAPPLAREVEGNFHQKTIDLVAVENASISTNKWRIPTNSCLKLRIYDVG
jgi:hypothetical protein